MNKESIFINSIKVKSFRGIKDLMISNCKRINFILGNNNNGKTSLLEVITLLNGRGKEDLQYLILKRHGRIENKDLIYLFNRDTKEINVEFQLKKEKFKVFSNYEINKVLFNEEQLSNKENIKELQRIFPNIPFINLFFKGKEATYFNVNYNVNDEEKNFILTDVNSLLNVKKETNFVSNIYYLSPYEHYLNSKQNVSDLLKSEIFKPIFLNLLKNFDENIEDVAYLESKSPFKNTFDLYVKCKGRDAEPISIYGDGIKKAIVISDAIARSVNGILLIDEIETSLHHQILSDIFYLLIRAAEQFNIQVFITTHSKETIETFLDIEKELNLNNVQFYTLKKTEKKTYCKFISSKDLNEQNDKFYTEVRE